MLTLNEAIVATFVAGGVTFLTRVTPFVFFPKGKLPPIAMYLEKYMPPMVMTVLVFYSLKDVSWATYPHGVPAIAGVVITLVLHLWRSNALMSIFGGTAIYMLLYRCI